MAGTGDVSPHQRMDDEEGGDVAPERVVSANDHRSGVFKGMVAALYVELILLVVGIIVWVLLERLF